MTGRRRGLNAVFWDGLFAQAMDTLTTGVILVGFALYLGATPWVIGILGAIPFFSNLFQLLSISLVERLRDRRRIVVTASLIGRSALALALLIPWMAPESGLVLLVCVICVRYVFGAISAGAWTSLMRDLVPQRLLGSYYATRMRWMTIVAAILGVAGALIIDYWQRQWEESVVWAFAGMYGLGFLASLGSLTMLLRLPEVPLPQREKKAYSQTLVLDAFISAWNHVNFRRLMIFMASWNFAANLAAPFFALYMLTVLNYDLTFVMLITLYSQAITAMALPRFGAYTDRFGNKPVLGFAATLFILCLVGWSFTTLPYPHDYTTPLLVLLHTLMGIATAGINLANNNVAFRLAPRSEATSFLVANSVLSSLTAGMAPLLGGLFADYFALRQLAVEIRWLSPEGNVFLQTLNLTGWDFFFAGAAIVGLYSLHRLSLIEEGRNDRRRAVARELMLDTSRMLRGIATVAGLRDIVTTPFNIVYAMVKRTPPQRPPRRRSSQ
ncbi:MAG TPA: MFS transporter [Gammaproteobacteria bacterium]|nr:MFS transporter [Gammaproteobacteria bacterium]